MMISLSSQYALRALAYISYQDCPMLSKEVANGLSISPTYLVKILQTLRKAKLLKASRGCKGGFQLNQLPSEISFMCVVSLFEDPAARQNCPLNQMICQGDPLIKCKLHDRWEKVSKQFIKFLDTTTIATIGKCPSVSKRSK